MVLPAARQADQGHHLACRATKLMSSTIGRSPYENDTCSNAMSPLMLDASTAFSASRTSGVSANTARTRREAGNRLLEQAGGVRNRRQRAVDRREVADDDEQLTDRQLAAHHVEAAEAEDQCRAAHA